MKTEFLKELGIEDKEVIKQIMAENGRDIESVRTEMESYKTQVEQLNSQLSDRDKQLKELKDSQKDNQELQTKITRLEELNNTFKIEYEQKIKDLEADRDLELKLRDSNARNVKAVKALIDKDKDIDEQIKELMKNEDTSFMFKTEEKEPPKGVTPASGGVTPSSNQPMTLSGAISKALNMKG